MSRWPFGSGRGPVGRPAGGPSDATRIARARGEILVELWTRPGCHLCEDARTVVEAAVRDTGARLREIDITDDAGLLRRFGEKIPVVHVDGRPHAQWRVDGPALEAAIRDAERRPAPTTDTDTTDEPDAAGQAVGPDSPR